LKPARFALRVSGRTSSIHPQGWVPIETCSSNALSAGYIL